MILEDISLSFQVPQTSLKEADVSHLKFAVLKPWEQEIQSQGFEMGMSQVKPDDSPSIFLTSDCLLEVFGISWFVAAQSQCLFCYHRRQDNSNKRLGFINLQWHFAMN